MSDRGHHRVDLDRVVSDERRIGLRRARRELPRGHVVDGIGRDVQSLRLALLLRATPLRLERRLEARDVDDVAALARHQLREIDRKAERVVQAKRVLAADRAATVRTAVNLAQRRELLEAGETSLDRIEEALLFDARRADDVTLALPQLWIDITHRVDHRLHDADERRLLAPEKPRMPNRSAQDAPEHIPAAVVRRKDTVGK